MSLRKRAPLRSSCAASHEPGKHAAKQEKVSRKLQVESLEPRLLMTAASSDSSELVSTNGLWCACPICTGRDLNLTTESSTTTGTTSTTTVATSSPISSIPQLSSRAGAAATIYLDFNGHSQSTWGQWSNAVTPVYSRDSDRTTFSSSELASIQEIWARVSEDFAPFNINVTTVEPPSFGDRVAVRVAIGGNWSDWFGQQAGGVAYVGSFANSAPNTAYVFSDALGTGNPRYVAEAVSHEVGHTLGLSHQATWNGNTLVDEYSSGTSAWAPVMGVGYNSARTTWHNGATSNSASSYQDDMAIIANSTNAFGYIADDAGNTQAAATALTVTSGSVSRAGVISTNSDIDVYSFTTTGGTVSLNVAVASIGANLDSVVELRNSSGVLIVSGNPSTSQDASLSASVGSGTYFVTVKSSGGYGNVGRYTLSGTIAGGSSGSTTSGGSGGTTTPAAPEISLFMGTSEIRTGGVVHFGSTVRGVAVDRTFTIKNTGTASLSLTSLSSSLPAGFSLVSNITRTSLTPGQSTTFTIRMTGATVGSPAGVLNLRSNDSDESTFRINLSGTVTAPPAARIIDNGAAGFRTSGAWTTSTAGRDRDSHFAAKGTGSSVATYTFSSLPSGTYQISATWGASKTNATDAPYTFYDGTRLLGSARVNQENSSTGISDAGSNWRVIGTFTVSSGTLVITLNNKANDRVVADAIRIQQVFTSSSASRSLLPEEVNQATSDYLAADTSAEMVALVSSSTTSSSYAAVSAESSASTSEFLAEDLAPEFALLGETISLVREMDELTSSLTGSSARDRDELWSAVDELLAGCDTSRFDWLER